MIGVWLNAEVTLASWLVATALTFSLATGCRNSTHPRDIRSVKITLERTACYGVCPVYTVTLHGSGLVEYTGKLRVDIPGPQTRTVNPASFRDLLGMADEIHFFEMQASYFESCTDLPTAIISILLDSKTKRVSNYYGGCEHQNSGPQVDLARLAEKIDAAAGTAHSVKCDYQCLTNLIQTGLNLNSQAPNGDTPLLTAIREGDSTKVGLLVDAGADLELADKQGMTPLMWAVIENQPVMVRELLKRGAAVNAKNVKGFTALQMAGDESIRWLLTGGGAK